MTVSYHLDLLSMLHHASAGLSSALPPPPAASGGSPASNPPTTAETTHFGADGTVVSAKSRTDYSQLKLGEHGRITGGTLSHAATDPSGKALDKSELTFDQHGAPATSRTTVHNRFCDGDFMSVAAQYDQVAWTPGMQVQTGTVSLTLVHPGTGKTRMKGKLTFDREKVTTGVFNHYGRAGDDEVLGQSTVDYSGAHTIGTRIVGGSCALRYRDKSGRLASTSTIHFAGTGVLEKIETDNLDPQSGKVRNSVLTDFSRASFDARNQLESGEVHFTSTNPGGAVKARRVTAFKAGLPVTTTTDTTTSKGAAIKLVTDFAGAKFNNDLRAVDSNVQTRLFDAEGRLLSAIVISYDANGNRLTKTNESFDPATGAPSLRVLTDYSDATSDDRGTHLSGIVRREMLTHATGETRVDEIHAAPRPPSADSAGQWEEDIAVPPLVAQPGGYTRKVTETHDSKGNLTGRTETVTRPDGTLVEQIETKVQNERPVSSRVARYEPDGKMVTATETMDLAALTYDPVAHRVSGQLPIKSLFKGSVTSATSVLSY